MINVITELKNQARASVVVAEIRRLVARAVLNQDAACAEIQDHTDTGAIPREIGQAALAQIP